MDPTSNDDLLYIALATAGVLLSGFAIYGLVKGERKPWRPSYRTIEAEPESAPSTWRDRRQPEFEHEWAEPSYGPGVRWIEEDAPPTWRSARW